MAAPDTAVMNIPLRVALISETFLPEINGVANTLGRLVDGLRTRGHQVQVVRPRQAEDALTPLEPDLLLTRGWPLPGYPGLQWGQSCLHKLLRHWRRQRPDVLYIATEGPLGLSALRAAKRLGIPVISGFHTNFQQYTGHYSIGLLTRAITNYLRWFHNRSQLTLVPSIGQKIELERRDFQRVALLARGVDNRLFHPSRRSDELRASWGLAPDDLAIIHVGRLAAEKNLGLLSRTFDSLQAAQPQRRMRLVLIGDGPQRASLEARMPHALFCGLKRGEELAAHYASGDLFLFPCLSETFGNVVLEALASGLAVAAYDQAAAAQHIQHGHNGVLARPGDEYGFREAACWLLEDIETLRRVRLNARQHASRQSWDGIVQQFENYLHSVMLPATERPQLPGAGSQVAIRSKH